MVGLVVAFAEDARFRFAGIASVEGSEPLAFLRAVAALRAALAVDLALWARAGEVRLQRVAAKTLEFELSVHLARQCEMKVDDGADVLLRQLWQLR
jgi:hypothetical protein